MEEMKEEMYSWSSLLCMRGENEGGGKICTIRNHFEIILATMVSLSVELLCHVTLKMPQLYGLRY